MSMLCSSSSFCLFLEFARHLWCLGLAGASFGRENCQGFKVFVRINLKLHPIRNVHLKCQTFHFSFQTRDSARDRNATAMEVWHFRRWAKSFRLLSTLFNKLNLIRQALHEEKTAIMFNLKLRINAPTVSQWGVKARPDEAMLTEAQYDSCMMLIWECVTRKKFAPKIAYSLSCRVNRETLDVMFRPRLPDLKLPPESGASDQIIVQKPVWSLASPPAYQLPRNVAPNKNCAECFAALHCPWHCFAIECIRSLAHGQTFSVKNSQVLSKLGRRNMTFLLVKAWQSFRNSSKSIEPLWLISLVWASQCWAGEFNLRGYIMHQMYERNQNETKNVRQSRPTHSRQGASISKRNFASLGSMSRSRKNARTSLSFQRARIQTYSIAQRLRTIK